MGKSTWMTFLTHDAIVFRELHDPAELLPVAIHKL